MHTNSTLGVSAGSPHTSVSRMTVLRFSGLVLDTGNCSGLHIYTAEGIGCHKSSWQSLGRHIYAEDSSPSAPQIHEYFSVLVSDRHHLRLCLIDRTSLMGLLSAVATRCTPARWCIQRIHRRCAPSCTSSCSRITDNKMSSSSGLRLLSLLSSFLPWPGARSRPRASSYLQWQCELHDLQWQRELFAVHSQVIARAAPVRP